MKRRILLISAAVLLVAVLVFGQNVANYMEQGGALWVIGNGGTLQVKSGGTLQVDSGATFSSAVITGNTGVTGTLSVSVPTTMDYLLGTKAAVNVGSVAATTLYTVPAGKTCIITKVIVYGASGTFDQGTDPVMSFGWNSTDFNNVITSATYTNAMAAATNYFILVPTGASASTVSTAGAAAGTFKVNVTTAATASTTCSVAVFGYLF